MTLPTIRHCLVSDAMREDVGNKVSILGFLGISPNVVGRYKRFDEPIYLAFMLIGDRGGDPLYDLKYWIQDAVGSVILPVSGGPLHKQGDGLLSIRMQTAAIYPGPGSYSLHVMVDGLEVYIATFELGTIS